MTFEQWKQANHPCWYLNGRQQDEELLEQYLADRRLKKCIIKKLKGISSTRDLKLIYAYIQGKE